MKRHLAYSLVVAVALLVGGLAVASTGAGQEATEFVQQPETWQPFVGEIRITDPRTPGEVVVGRVYRWSDGSERNDTGPEGGPIKVISIRNHSTNWFYVWREDKGWHRRPLGVSLTRPLKRIHRVGERSYFEDAPPIEGLKILRSVKGKKTRLLAPDLNMYAVVLEEEGARRVEIHNIRLEEPSPELLVPPSGVKMTESSVPVDRFKQPLEPQR